MHVVYGSNSHSRVIESSVHHMLVQENIVLMWHSVENIIKCLPFSFCYWPVCRAELTWTEQRAKWPKRNITLTELKNCLVCLKPLTVFFLFFTAPLFSNDISFPSWIRTLPEAIFYIMAKFETWKKYPSAIGKYFWHLICKYVLF